MYIYMHIIVLFYALYNVYMYHDNVVCNLVDVTFNFNIGMNQSEPHTSSTARSLLLYVRIIYNICNYNFI